MKRNLILTSIFLFAISLIFSCKKNDDDNQKPVVTGLEIGLDDSHEAHRGGDIHLEFEVTDDEELGYYSVEIQPETKTGGSTWTYQNRWDFDAGLRNALVHSHEITVPADAEMGLYSFLLVVSDKAGNLLTFEEEITVLEQSSGDGPEIHIENHPEENEVFVNDEVISISGHVHSETSHIAGIFVGIVSEAAGLADSLVNASNSIVLYHQHDFELYEVEFLPVITVGAAEDNNYPVPNAVADWNLGDAYILVKSVDEEGNWSFSQHYHIKINAK